MTFKVVTCILLLSNVVLGRGPQFLDLQDIESDYYIDIPQDKFPGIFGFDWLSRHGVEKLPEPESNVGEVKQLEYKEIGADVLELINALKDFGMTIAEEVRIIKEIIHSKNQ